MSRRALARPVIGELQANMPTSSRLASRLTSTCPVPPPASRWAIMEHSCLRSTHNHHQRHTLLFPFLLSFFLSFIITRQGVQTPS